jgi:hypothetical protein
MNSLEDNQHYITLTFSLPEDFLPPSDGDGQTSITVQTANSMTPVKVAHYQEPVLRSGRWNFSFAHNYFDVSVKYRVTVSMTHNGAPLLIDLDYFVIVHRAPHRQTLHLSPIGRLYIQAQEPEVVEPEHAVTIIAHEHDNATVQLTQVHISEHMAEAFYLEYDPDTVVPGKRYTLRATENEYRNSIEVSPHSVVLKPFSKV